MKHFTGNCTNYLKRITDPDPACSGALSPGLVTVGSFSIQPWKPWIKGSKRWSVWLDVKSSCSVLEHSHVCARVCTWVCVAALIENNSFTETGSKSLGQVFLPARGEGIRRARHTLQTYSIITIFLVSTCLWWTDGTLFLAKNRPELQVDGEAKGPRFNLQLLPNASKNVFDD